MSISPSAGGRAAAAFGAAGRLPEPVARFVALAAPPGSERVRTIVLATVAWRWRPGVPRIRMATTRRQRELGRSSR